MTHESPLEALLSTRLAADASAPHLTLETDSSSDDLALAIAQAADDRKGDDIVLLKVADVSYLADYFVLVTGFSHVQVRAIANSIEQTVKEKLQRVPVRIEGQAEGNWVLIDYGDVIAHIFLEKDREFYNLEAFWGHAERLSFAALQSASTSAKG
ncbi:ribosome silencing factor [Thermoleptolyngbya oregonensis NK1-22]|jgi:ribosome-associated protein|uniref:Ribosomal silencing factor RsfS n=1 Tax=Thermoleptolyngbya oregonensis NK1-22 TaxID=2547457 RepID=A0AA96Y7B1_9CYAN|nr:ribosome silencing factor [Thermoleptolyngbya oregonensis]WOB42383.1 ribosome silencing factor [Thermoleptolyngbya oregonensis NK1-22]